MFDSISMFKSIETLIGKNDKQHEKSFKSQGTKC